MYNYSFYSAILGLSSEWSITNVNFDEQSGNIEMHIHNAGGNSFICPRCGSNILKTENRKGHWLWQDNFNLRFHIYAIIPQVTCERCGEVKIHLPWEQRGFENKEFTSVVLAQE
jgi:predicted RNA-binding Zn-ribbon protein involved in translation (DUF1610 family)